MGIDYSAAVENSIGAPAAITRRRVFESYQPTAMSRAGMHALPPVSVRTPIADQYAMGIMNPDVSFKQADPVTWSGPVNGTASPAQGPQERAQLRATMREQATERKRSAWHVVDDGSGRFKPPMLPGS